ncbi:aminotransferase class I/II-fold pyridoxal phosphate-dependent enzyme [Actinophytocola sp.]|uniref:aminotransferase class I/II-fold pyridoxal phosphate-dependent enzyme n=1 Tax=Actinophytocola sp. TaxID=1872138 RepID=UPI002D32F5FD|nr:aminotransferase class I/II-fold pyridoxal phosphate-dependent enzyme [Actinophytocola sp.]HYQ68985.1 aminotransferase class I/II-fold pyridoxal phosphate-dependent enzyme [Actinophytocola sp.]
MNAYEELRARGLRLDLTRGKPSAEQLDLANPLLALPGPADFRAADASDVRNYGGLRGLPELRAIFAPLLGVAADRLLAAGNASLELMHDYLVHAVLFGVPGGDHPWRDAAFLCPVPGYDRHFAICAKLGIEMIPVALTGDGPDMAEVERLVAEDARVKGVWCVPKYSNPTGETYSPAVVRRLAAMPTAAPDFRVFWDNAYAVHHLTTEPREVEDLLPACESAGNPDRALVFGSTSKITFAGAGVGFFGASDANLDWFTGHLSKRTIGPDKINHLRHTRFLRSPDGVLSHMARHRELLAPKFELVERVLTEQLTGVATWTTPEGGYFVSLRVTPGCATRVVELAAQAGIALTPAGAPFPYGRDPEDAVIRIAPTYPPLPELADAMNGLAVCVRLATDEHLGRGPVR